jgi:hypothetical protein
VALVKPLDAATVAILRARRQRRDVPLCWVCAEGLIDPAMILYLSPDPDEKSDRDLVHARCASDLLDLGLARRQSGFAIRATE